MLTILFVVLLGLIGLALMGFGIYGVIRDKFSTQTSGGALGGQITLPLSGLLVILGLVALGFAAYLQATTGTGTTADGTVTQASGTPTGSPTQGIPGTPIETAPSPSTSSPVPSSASAAISSSHAVTPMPVINKMKLTCVLNTRKILPGSKLTMTYYVSSPSTRKVGLGAGVYDEQGNDDSNGDGDVPSVTLKQGVDTLSRAVSIPVDLPAGNYELDAEIWPANEIGQNSVDDLIDAVCLSFRVS